MMAVTIVVNLRDIIMWAILALVGLVLLGAWLLDLRDRRRRRP